MSVPSEIDRINNNIDAAYNEVASMGGTVPAAANSANLAAAVRSIPQSLDETDPVFKASAASSITATDIENWNAKADASDIPDAVTESTVSGWGFTKNNGTYSKPSTGIPKTDLASEVQTSLGKADTAYGPNNPPPYPVTSVNGKTGAVTVDSGSKPVQYMVTVSPSWSQNSTSKLYSTSFTVGGLLASYSTSPDIDLNLNGKSATDCEALIKAYSSIAYATTATNSLTLYSTANITVQLPLIIRVFP